MSKQKLLFESGNELAAYAAKQINYHVMGILSDHTIHTNSGIFGFNES